MFSVWNEGFLPEGLTLKALRRQHPSRPRNPLIADVCFKGGYIDAWGRGTLKVFESCKDASLPEPEMKEEDGGMMVRLFKTRTSPNQLLQLGLNSRQMEMINYLQINGEITSHTYQGLMHLSPSAAKSDLSQLVSLKLIRKVGVSVPKNGAN